MLIGYPLVFFFFFFFLFIYLKTLEFNGYGVFRNFGIWDMGYQTLPRDIEKMGMWDISLT